MKGKVFLGIISGFMFGLFLGPTLWLWGVIPFASPLMWILPLVGIVLGMIMAAWAPFGKGPEAVSDQAPAETSSSVVEDEGESVDQAAEPVASDGSEEE
jgi:hypothetical protein